MFVLIRRMFRDRKLCLLLFGEFFWRQTHSQDRVKFYERMLEYTQGLSMHSGIGKRDICSFSSQILGRALFSKIYQGYNTDIIYGYEI